MKKTENIAYVLLLAFIAALGGFLFGYDTAVISGTTEDVKAHFSLTDMQLGWYVGCAIVGSIIGVLMAGKLSDVFGRKPVLLFSAVLFTASAAGCAIYTTFDQLVMYRIIGGVGIGVASIISPLYISEISITRFRGSMVALYQLAITIGILGSYLANSAVLKWSNTVVFDDGILKLWVNDEVWRAMLGMETIPAILFFLVIFFIPESPRWLIVKQKNTAAIRVLEKIYVPERAQQEFKNVQELVSNDEKSNWRLLLQPGFRIALFIGVALAILGQFMGVNAVFYYGPKFLGEAGMDKASSLDLQVWIGLVNVLSTILAMFIIDKIGRKKLVYIGVSGMIVMLGCIGAFFYAYAHGSDVSGNLLLFFMMSYVFFCAISICVVIWVLVSEMYPVKIRGAAMSIAGFSLWIGTYLIGQLTPWLTSTLSAYGVFWLFGVMCIPYLLITYFMVPETTGKSLEDIEKMWRERSKKES